MKEFGELKSEYKAIEHKISSLEDAQDTVEKKRIELYFRLAKICSKRSGKLCGYYINDNKSSHYSYYPDNRRNICQEFCPRLRF